MERKLNCEEVFHRLDDYLDRELTAEEMKLVTSHIETCHTCASEHRFESRLLSGVKDKLRRIRMPEDMKSRLLDHLRKSES